MERLVDLLRYEVDRFRVEAEVSRNCLEDLRLNSVFVRSKQHHITPSLFSESATNSKVYQPELQKVNNVEPLKLLASSYHTEEFNKNVDQEVTNTSKNISSIGHGFNNVNNFCVESEVLSENDSLLKNNKLVLNTFVSSVQNETNTSEICGLFF